MAKETKKKPDEGYQQLKKDLKAGTLGSLYIFHGEEAYLRDFYLEQMKEKLIPAGMESFNYHQLQGKGLTVQKLAETVDALPMYASRKSVDLFVKHGIYTKEEMVARAEIHIENYSAVISIEANTMIDMIRHDILPAVSEFTDELCQRAFHKESMNVSCKYDLSTARELGRLTDALMSACDKLEKDMGKKPAETMDAMVYCHDVIIPDMKKAREIADELETITAAKNWPFPVYSELLFSV